MPGLSVPNDWDGIDYCYLSVRVPDSLMWRGAVRGAVRNLSYPYIWDKATGDRDQTAAIASEIEVQKMIIPELQFIAHLSGVQLVSNYDELFELDVAEYNLNGQFDVVNHRWVVPETGLYKVGVWVQFWNMSGSGNWVRVRTKTNGVFHLNSGNVRVSADEYPHAHLDDLPAFFNASDVVEFFVTQSDIGTNRGTADYNQTCRAWAYRVG